MTTDETSAQAAEATGQIGKVVSTRVLGGPAAVDVKDLPGDVRG